MSEPRIPSVLWSVIGIGLPAFTSVMSFVAALVTDKRAFWISAGVVFAGVTVLAVQRVYRAFTARPLSPDPTTNPIQDG